MKALILCAGAATRLHPLTHTWAKAAIPVANRPVLVRVAEYLTRFGIRSMGIVVTPTQQSLRVLEPALTELEVEVTWLEQAMPMGIAHALQSARDFLGDEPFLLYLGDNLTDEDLTPALARFAAEKPAALLLVGKVANPSAFGVAVIHSGRVQQVLEKPAHPPSNLAITGLYLFGPAIWGASASLRPSSRGELEITDAIAELIKSGQPVLAHEIQGWWQDMGSPQGLLAANRELLDRLRPAIAPDADLVDCQMHGCVAIGPGCKLRRVTLCGPLLLGRNCRLTDTCVGPYTCLGDGVVLEATAVEHALLLPGCRLAHLPHRLTDCVLASDKAVLHASHDRR